MIPACSWPSVYEPVSDEAIRHLDEDSHSKSRVEIRCGNCDAHLGIFSDGLQPTEARFCVNSASLRFRDGENGEEIAG